MKRSVKRISSRAVGAAVAAVVLAGSTMVASPAMAQSADWMKSVARAIAAKQTYPRTAQMRGEEGTARVKVYISASGAVERTEMVSPSGSTQTASLIPSASWVLGGMTNRTPLAVSSE